MADAWPPDVAVLAAGSTISGAFVVIGLVVLVIGMALSARRVSRARDLARDAGDDPTVAAGRAVLGDSFWTRLLTRLRQRRPPEPGLEGSVRERLSRLAELRDEGLITPAEYDERRRAILDSL